MAIASSLLQAIKICQPACPPSVLLRFSQGSIPESWVKKKSQQVIQHLLKMTTPIDYKKYMVSTDVE